MRYLSFVRWSGIVLSLVGLVLLPTAVYAQSVSGEAAAVVASVAGATTALGDTGWLSSPSDALSASVLASPIATLGSVESLSSDTISSISNWSPPDEVSSQASAASLVLNVLGHVLSADFILSQVSAPVGGTPQPLAMIQGLALDGVPLAVSGAPNQVVQIPGLQLVIDEVQNTASGTTVNALHLTSLDGTLNVVVATATAGVSTATSGGSSGGGLLGGL